MSSAAVVIGAFRVKLLKTLGFGTVRKIKDVKITECI